MRVKNLFWSDLIKTKVPYIQMANPQKNQSNKSCSIFPTDSLVFYVWGQNFDFRGKRINFGPICRMLATFYLHLHNQITSKIFYVCKKLQKKTLLGRWLKIFYFSTLWIWKFGIFQQTPAGMPNQGKLWVPLVFRAQLGY